jgi:hypothetical protein
MLSEFEADMQAYNDYMNDNFEEVEDVIYVPKGATNGDVQKIILSDFEFEHHGDTVIGKRYAPYCKVQFDIRWWNAPYEREVDE